MAVIWYLFMKTFLFYDIETSGLNSSFDQVLTFAAIRTDLNLNEISREYIIVKLRPDIVPSPGAFITHRLSLQELNSGLCEYEAAGKIHEIINTPDTISLGYNTLGFDDEFLRFTFYRNLFSPYIHQYANGCSRMDVLPLTILYRLFKPWVLKWPQLNGRPSLKLELISGENSLVSSGRAHNAMVDVEATVALAKLLFHEKEMWNYCLDFFDKKKDQARIEQIEPSIHIDSEDYRLCIMVSLSFGSKVMYMAPVLSIGHSTKYTNQSLWLRLDTEKILPDKFDPDRADLFAIRKKYGEAAIVLPPAERFWNRLLNTQRDTCKKNLSLINDSPGLFKEVVKYHQDYQYSFIPELDYDASLYQAGFFSWQEKKEIAIFHDASMDEKVKLSIVPESPIKSRRIKDMAFRIMFRNYSDSTSFPSGVSPVQTQDVIKYLNRLRSFKPGDAIKGFRNDVKLTCYGAAGEIKRLKKENRCDGEQLEILDWIESYIKTMQNS